MGVFALLQGAYFESYLKAALYAYTVYGAAVTPAVVAVFFWKRANAAGAVSSIVAGTLITVVWNVLGVEIVDAVLSGAGRVAASADRGQFGNTAAGHSKVAAIFPVRRMSMNLAAIQDELRKQELDGWLFFDHHLRDPLAYRVLGFDAPQTPTRRWYYSIPSVGEPRGLVHRIEAGMIDALPGEKIRYSRWTEQVGRLAEIAGWRPACSDAVLTELRDPVRFDGGRGTVELVRGAGAEVASSAELIQALRRAGHRRRWIAPGGRTSGGSRAAPDVRIDRGEDAKRRIDG